MTLVKLASLGDVKPGTAKAVSLNNHNIALYNVNGKIYATSNVCPHKGGPLGEGELDGDVITCPLHGWKFNVITGQQIFMPNTKVKTYTVVMQGNDIMVDL